MSAITDTLWECGRCGEQFVPETDGDCTNLACARERLVLLETVALAAMRLLATLPKCDQCRDPATRGYASGDERCCDKHGLNAHDYPMAQPIRDTTTALLLLGV